MNTETTVLFTTTPIPLQDLVRKQKEDIQFVIDYKNSKFRNKSLLVYLTNLDIKCRLHLESIEDALPLVKDYLHLPQIATAPDLDDAVVQILLHMQGKPSLLSFDPTEFIAENRDILDTWMKRIRNLPLFALYATGEFDEVVQALPADENISVAGLNYVNLIKHPFFALLVEDVRPEEYSYNEVLFNKYIFAGKNLFYYFAVKENPLFIGSLIAMEGEEAMQQFLAAAAADNSRYDQIAGSLNVPSLR